MTTMKTAGCVWLICCAILNHWDCANMWWSTRKLISPRSLEKMLNWEDHLLNKRGWWKLNLCCILIQVNRSWLNLQTKEQAFLCQTSVENLQTTEQVFFFLKLVLRKWKQKQGGWTHIQSLCCEYLTTDQKDSENVYEMTPTGRFSSSNCDESWDQCQTVVNKAQGVYQSIVQNHR